MARRVPARARELDRAVSTRRPDAIDTASTVLTVCGGAALAFALFGAAAAVAAGWVP